MITFYLVNLKRKQSAIYILVSFRGSKYRRTTGEAIPVKYWSKSKKRSKVSAEFREGAFINDVLNKWYEAANRSVAYFKQFRYPPSSKDFFSKLDDEFYQKEEAKIPLFCAYIETYIARYKPVRSIITVRKYNNALNKLREYETDAGVLLSFESINIDFYNQFQKWFYSKGFSSNYFGTVIKVIKQIYREARVVDRLHSFHDTEHNDFVTVSRPAQNIYLTEDELMRIYKADISEAVIAKEFPDLTPFRVSQKSSAMNLARQRFLIGAYSGLRVSDFSRLTAENFDGFIRVRTVKTDFDTVIPIHSVIKEMLTSGFDPDESSMSPQKINKHIKEVARMAGLVDDVLIYKNIGGRSVAVPFPKYKLITSHTARRSFATNAYKAGVPTLAIMQITGHKKESTFLKYIKVTAEENAERLESHPFFSGNGKSNAVPNAVPNKSDD